ncbi:MAG: hypothetical protein ACM32E_22955 [Gemmatimonadota bacterium]
MVNMAAVVSPHPHHRGHCVPRGRNRADQAGVPLDPISLPWRDRVVASALRRERGVFGLRNAIGA